MLRNLFSALALLPICALAQYPVACFPFTAGTATDVTGNGFDGTVVGATTVADRSGIPGGALDFNGTSARVELGAFGDMIPTDEFSVSIWVKADASNSDAVIMTQPDDAYDRLCISPHYAHSGGNTVFWDYGDIFNGGRIAIDPYPFSPDWHHWVFVHSAEQDRMSIYVDGVLAHEEDHHSAIVDRSKPVWIGGGIATGGGDFFFHGVLDDVQFYTAALSNAAVGDLYVSQLTGFTCSLVGIAEVSGVAAPRFTLNGGTVLVDWPSTCSGDISVFDTEGRLVATRTAVSGTRWQLPLSRAVPGLYTVRCLVEGVTSAGRVVIE